MNYHVMSPKADKRGTFVYDQVVFLKAIIPFLDDYRKMRSNSYSGYDPVATEEAMGDKLWGWAVGNLERANISGSDYGFFVFDQKAKDCFIEQIIDSGVFVDIPYNDVPMFAFLPAYRFRMGDDIPQSVCLFRNEKGETIVNEAFLERYNNCKLTGLKFSDPSVPFWKR